MRRTREIRETVSQHYPEHTVYRSNVDHIIELQVLKWYANADENGIAEDEHSLNECTIQLFNEPINLARVPRGYNSLKARLVGARLRGSDVESMTEHVDGELYTVLWSEVKQQMLAVCDLVLATPPEGVPPTFFEPAILVQNSIDLAQREQHWNISLSCVREDAKGLKEKIATL